MTTEFDYVNLSGRPRGPFVRLASLVHPGVRAVQAQVEPYAQAWRRDNLVALASSGPMWVALGDSLSLGIGASAHDRGWVGVLGTLLPGWRVVNLAVSGGRIRDVLDRQLPALQALGAVPDLVTVLVGSNDVFSRQRRRALTADLTTLLDRLPPGAVVGNQPGDLPAALELNRVIDDTVVRRDLRLAEFRVPRMRDWRGRLAADRFHPNDEGYAGIADVFARALPY
jgi:lysophospholipase L1-like esterase